MKKLKKLLIFSLLPLLLTAKPVFADCPALPDANSPEPWQLCHLVGIVQIAINLITTLAVLIFFIMILIGGFQFLFSGGDTKGVEKARNTLTWAIIGLVILLLIWFLLLAVQAVTGVQVTDFKIGI